MQTQLVLNILFAILASLAGVILVILPHTDEMQETLFLQLQRHGTFFSLIGFCLIGIGTVSLQWIMQSFKNRYFKQVHGTMRLWVQEGIFSQSSERFIKQWFPEQSVYCKAYLSHNNLYIDMQVPYREKTERIPIVNAIQDGLRQHFIKYLGYAGDFKLNISFASKPHFKLPTEMADKAPLSI